MIRGFIKRVTGDANARDKQDGIWSFLRKKLDEIDPRLETPLTMSAAVEAVVTIWETKAQSYREAIEVVLRERDGWKDRFAQNVAGHIAAQLMLQRAIQTQRMQLGLLARRLRALVENDEADAIFAAIAKLNDPPVGVAGEFEENMTRLTKEAGEEIDAIAARNKIDVAR